MTSLAWKGQHQRDVGYKVGSFMPGVWVLTQKSPKNLASLICRRRWWNANRVWKLVRDWFSSRGHQSLIQSPPHLNSISPNAINKSSNIRNTAERCITLGGVSTQIVKVFTSKCIRWASSYQKCCDQIFHISDNRCARPQIKWGVA